MLKRRRSSDHWRARFDELEVRRSEANDAGDWTRVVQICQEELELRPDLIMPRLRIAWHQARFEGGDRPERLLDQCLADGIGSDQADSELIRHLLWNLQQSPDPSRHQGRLHSLLEVVERSPSLDVSERTLARARVRFALGDRAGFLAESEHLPQPSTLPASQRPVALRVLAAARRWAEPQFPDFAAPKAFVIGLSRTGTSSMDQALQVLGMSSIHWLNPISMDLIRPTDYLLFDAFSDLGVTAEFETLFHRFSRAKFVMTARPLESWERSVRRHFARNARVDGPSELIGTPLAQTFRGMKGMIESSVYGHFDSWADAHRAHEERVSDFFSGRRADSLLRFDATAGDGWGKLCQFLGVPVPERPYPHTNHGKPVGPSVEDSST